MRDFAQRNFGFSRDKGLDFIAKFNDKYILGEAKFLTDFGGHQNAQFMDAISTLTSPLKSRANVITIAILDGVLYIKGKNKMYKELCAYARTYPILSALLLRDFLYAL